MILETTEYIDSITTLTTGTDLFAGYVEPDVSATCVIVEEVNPSPTHYLLTDKTQKAIRILSRAPAYFTARDNANEVFDNLHGRMQVTLPVVESGPTYLCNFVGNKPYYLGRDEARNHIFTMDFVVETQTE